MDFTSLMLLIGNISVLVLVICSMLSKGMSLTISQIGSALQDKRLVALSLIANFVIVPIMGILLIWAFPLPQGMAIGFFIILFSAGAPLLPKLAQNAKGNIAFAVALMALTMVLTAVILPIMLPLALPGTAIDPWSIAQPLVFLMLLPLGIGLLVRARLEAIAKSLAPYLSKVSTVALVTLVVGYFAGYFNELVGVIGSTAILAAIIFLASAFGVGYSLGGPASENRRVLGLGTAQRNLEAAAIIAAINFYFDPTVMVMILVIGLLGLVMLLVIGGVLGRRAAAREIKF